MLSPDALFRLTLVFMCLFSLSARAVCSKPVLPAFDEKQYYASIANQHGDALKAALNHLIKGHVRYDYTPCVWDILQETDVDPDTPDNVIAFYTRRSIPISQRDFGGNTPDAWNREHIWAKSHGFPSKLQHGYTDVHHLRPTDKSVNADRGNFDFAEGGSPHTECTDCYINPGAGTWESPDEVKGDTARMMFYMAVRYEGGDNSETPDLELVDSTTSINTPQFGKLCDLMRWHIDDPVSAAERLRNDKVYSWQGNRNPFIDHPEYAVAIWGEQCGIESPVPAVAIPAMPLWVQLLWSVLLVSMFFRFNTKR